MQQQNALQSFQLISRNLDFSLRVSKAKTVLVCSDKTREGKSRFIAECAPVLSGLYRRKILIFDFQPERNNTIEKELSPMTRKDGPLLRSSAPGVDYIHLDDLQSLKGLDKRQREEALKRYFRDVSQNYDLVLLNTKTMKQADKNSLPDLPIDGAVLVTSGRTLGGGKRPVCEEVREREIPILGIVMNGGV